MPEKVCPNCSDTMPVAKIVCDNCGNVLISRRHVAVKSKKQKVQALRALETFDETLKRREKDKLLKAAATLQESVNKPIIIE